MPEEHVILDALPDAPNVVVASPSSGHGFELVPVVASVVADLALEGATERDIDMFQLARFAGDRSRPGAGPSSPGGGS